MKKLTKLICILFLASLFPITAVMAQSKSSTDTGYLGNDQWIIDSDGDLAPASDSAQDIGASGSEIDVIYADEIYLGGTSKTSWGSVVSPITDASGYVYPTDSGGVVRLYDAGYIALGAGTAVDTYILFDGDSDDYYIGQDDTDNDLNIGVGSTIGTDARITIADDADNSIITIGDNTNAYDHYLVFDGNGTDQYLGYMDTYDMVIAGDGSTVDADMAFGIENSSNPKLVVWNGVDGYGAIDIDYGSADITDHTFVSDGGTLVLDGTITLTSGEVISNATDDTVRIASNDVATVLEVFADGESDHDATLLLTADKDADAGDRMAIVHDGGTNSMLFQSDTASADTLATILTLAKTGVVTTTAAINAEIDDSANTSVTDIVNIQHFTSGTAGSGIGAGLTFDLENDAGTEEEHAYIDAVSTDASDGAEDTDLVFGVMTAGTVAEVLRIDANNSATTGDQLIITSNTTETNGVTDILSLANVTGTAAANTGLGITWDFEDASGAEEQASLDVVLIDETNATEDADFIFKQQSAGAVTETLRIAGTQSATSASYLQMIGNTSETNGVVDVLKLQADTSGTGAAGLGTGISIQVDDAGGVEEQASIDVALTTATNGSEDADVIISQNTAGAIAETLRLVAASSATTSDYLQYTANTTETDGVTDILVLKTATGTAANNYGIGISFQPEDATGSEEVASLDIVETTAARATNDTDFVFSQNVNGTITERVRFDADGSNLVLSGATPAITIGDADEEDTSLIFDGNAQDFHVGLDDTADDLVIGVGSALGTTTGLAIDENTDVTVSGNLITEGSLDLGTVQTFTDADATPDVSDGSYFITNTTSVTITDFDGAGIVDGQIIVVESAGAITYDVTGEGLKGGTTDIVTADGDLTTWLYNGTDWLLISFTDMSDDLR